MHVPMHHPRFPSLRESLFTMPKLYEFLTQTVYTLPRGRCGIEWLKAPSSVALSAEMNTEFTYRRTYVWRMLHLGKGCNVFDGGRRVCDRQLCTLEVTKSGNSMYQRLQSNEKPKQQHWRLEKHLFRLFFYIFAMCFTFLNYYYQPVPFFFINSPNLILVVVTVLLIKNVCD